ncbi:hypothetical protein SLS61_003381 [Didymella pomorum]
MSTTTVQQDGSTDMVVETIPFDATPLDMANNGISADETGPEDPSLLPQESDLFNPSSVGSMSDLESLFESSNGLIWNDLFDTTFDMSMPLIHDQLYDQPYSDPLSLLAHVAHQPQSHGGAMHQFDIPYSTTQLYEKQNLNATNTIHHPMLQQSSKRRKYSKTPSTCFDTSETMLYRSLVQYQ